MKHMKGHEDLSFRKIKTAFMVFMFFMVISWTVDARVQVDPQAIQRMAATERAFAAATAEIGTRDGFLTFFAADAIHLVAGATGAAATVVSARPGLQSLPAPQLPLRAKLMWAPFTGQVSSDGSMGWLTGAFVSLDTQANAIGRQGAYFSVWKRQPDGTWRVWLDEGVGLPAVWQDAAPFRVFVVSSDDSPVGGPGESLEAAERGVSEGAENWRARLASAVRLHRDGQMPIVGRDAVQTWARSAWTSVRYTPLRAEPAASGDLGVTLGGYDATAPGGAEHGIWIRVWARNPADRWRIVFESSTRS